MPSIRVLNVSFDCPTPYIAGHQCTEAEAAELNRLRVARVSAAARKRIQQRGASAAELSEFAKDFVFTSSYEVPADPQQLEATKIARGTLRESLTRRGETEQSIGKERYEALLAELAGSSVVQAEASRRVRATQQIASQALLSGDIGGT